MHSWRNWQTRKTKDLVERSMQVQLLLSAPKIAGEHYVHLLFFMSWEQQELRVEV